MMGAITLVFTKRKVSLFFTILIVNQVQLFGQSLEQLKQQQVKLEKKIELINSQIEKTEKQKLSATTNLKLLNSKIELKYKLIKELEEQESLIQEKIFELTNSVDSLNIRIAFSTEEYCRFIINIQKRDFKRPILIYLLSSNSFIEAFRRFVYYDDYLSFQKRLIIELSNNKKVLKSKKELLNQNLYEIGNKEQLRVYEVNKLLKTKELQKKKEKDLNRKKRELIAELELNKNVSKKLVDEIEKLIEEERRKLVSEKNKKPNEQIVFNNKSFTDNIGKFNLPVSNGVVVGKYGESDHPILKNIKIKNNGIDISLTESTDVFSIFNGEVRKVFKIPGSKLAIIIRHGNFLTVYSNLTEVFVKSGSVVQTNQKIGHIKQSKEKGSEIFHFEIWNENKSENPIKYFKD